MNKEWSELCKTMQAQLRKETTFQEGIDTLLVWHIFRIEDIVAHTLISQDKLYSKKR